MKTSTTSRLGARAGFTLIEVAISVTLIAIIAAFAGMVSKTGNSAYEGTSLTANLNSKVKLTLDRVALELQLAAKDTFFPTMEVGVTNTSSLVFQQLVDIQAGAPVYGGPTVGQVMAIRLVMDVGEVDDGIDNNGDGLIDEKRLVLARDLGVETQMLVTICHDVSEMAEGEVAGGGDENGNGLIDEQGFDLQREGDVITIRLSIQRVSSSGVVLERTAETSLRLRN
ncbi:MAG: prepilin-type N-terminal cleavage/methylation domain-containing protein [Planctomycetota bacterium]